MVLLYQAGPISIAPSLGSMMDYHLVAQPGARERAIWRRGGGTDHTRSIYPAGLGGSSETGWDSGPQDHRS